MKLLVVHDREEVLTQIVDVIRGHLGQDAYIRTAKDFVSARDYLKDEIFDLMIMDLTIPISQNSGDANFQAAEALLKELFDYGTLNVPGDIIGMTRDLDMLDLVRTQLGPHLMIAIGEDADGKWKKYLTDKIDYATKAMRTRFVSINRHYNYDLLIITAIDKESLPYDEYFEFSKVDHFTGAKEFAFNDKNGSLRKGILYSIGQSGQPPATSFSQALVTMFRPKLAIMSGYCGGVKGKVEFGDLIFFEAAYAWDYGKWEEVTEDGLKKSVFYSRPNPIDIKRSKAHNVIRDFMLSNFDKEPDLIQKIKELSLGALDHISKHYRSIGSGSAVVANDEIVAKIRNLNDEIWGVDMESYGFYHACQNTQVVKPEAICVKSVSDFCNGEKGDKLHTACSYISASAVYRLITQFWDFSA